EAGAPRVCEGCVRHERQRRSRAERRPQCRCGCLSRMDATTMAVPMAFSAPVYSLLSLPSAFSGHLLGNNQGFVVRTTEVSIHTFHQFCCRQQTAGLDHGPFPMDPMCLQGVEPRTFDGQETRHNAQAVAVMFDPLVVLSEPVSHGTAAMPRGIIP